MFMPIRAGALLMKSTLNTFLVTLATLERTTSSCSGLEFWSYNMMPMLMQSMHTRKCMLDIVLRWSWALVVSNGNASN